MSLKCALPWYWIPSGSSPHSSVRTETRKLECMETYKDLKAGDIEPAKSEWQPRFSLFGHIFVSIRGSLTRWRLRIPIFFHEWISLSTHLVNPNNSQWSTRIRNTGRGTYAKKTDIRQHLSAGRELSNSYVCNLHSPKHLHVSNEHKTSSWQCTSERRDSFS